MASVSIYEFSYVYVHCEYRKVTDPGQKGVLSHVDSGLSGFVFIRMWSLTFMIFF